MSVVVAMCRSNYALMAGDSRLVEYKNGKVVRIISENTKKVFKLNDYVMLGITGDYLGYEYITKNIVQRDNIHLDIPQITQDVYDCASSFKLECLPLNILIAGKGKNGGFIIAEMKSEDEYKPIAYFVPNHQSHQVRIALPEIDDMGVLQQIDKRVERLKLSTTIDEMQTRIENLIKNIANKNETVNKIVHCERIV